jgi:hypothetical protein
MDIRGMDTYLHKRQSTHNIPLYKIWHPARKNNCHPLAQTNKSNRPCKGNVLDGKILLKEHLAKGL